MEPEKEVITPETEVVAEPAHSPENDATAVSPATGETEAELDALETGTVRTDTPVTPTE